MTEIMPSLQNLIKLSYDAPAFRRAFFNKLKSQSPVSSMNGYDFLYY